MNTTDQERLLDRIVSEWKDRWTWFRPWGVWIRQYATLPDGADEVDWTTFPKAVWFLDASGLRQEDIWKWMRFLRFRQMDLESGAAYLRKDTHEIGFAAFAPYPEAGRYYVETIWGPTTGMGWEAIVPVERDASIQETRRLWVS